MSDRLDRLEKIVESNSKAIEALANGSAESRQQMEETRKIAESNAKAIKALANESTDFHNRITTTIELLTQVVVRLDARQQDQENRINRLEQD
jgi:uncharacterized coiled-coil DUF342 family protein